MRDARAHVLGEAVLLEVDGLFDDLLFRFQISQSTPPSLTLFARQHTANTAIVSIGLSRICPEARCQAATQAAICHAKAARRRLLSSRSTVPAQGPTRYMHMLGTCCVVSSEVLYALAPAPLPEAMSRR